MPLTLYYFIFYLYNTECNTLKFLWNCYILAKNEIIPIEKYRYMHIYLFT